MKEKSMKRDDIKKGIEDKYKNGPGAFKLQTDERPMDKGTLIKQAEEEEKKILQFNKKYHNPPPNFKEIEAEVKLMPLQFYVKIIYCKKRMQKKPQD